MSADGKRVAIVGGGLAGLSCALRLEALGAKPILFEGSGEVGGRVRTDAVDGFLLDRGFQVYLSAYPEAGKLLDLDALDLCRFQPGAQVYRNGGLHRVMDVFRSPRHLLSSAFAPVGSVWDKILVAKLRRRMLRKTLGEIASGEDMTTEAWLREFGFSEKMIDVFFRPFYGGIFLESGLKTSSQMFEFTFKMFSQGFATFPAKGMGEIPRQLAGRLSPGVVKTEMAAVSLDRKSVRFVGGETVDADAVVVATDLETAGRLVPGFEETGNTSGWRSVTGIYFSAPRSPLNEAIIALNGSGSGRVNHICCLSDVSPAYAPAGRALMSVSVLGVSDEPDLEARVLEELEGWFGDGKIAGWVHLRTDRIRLALPEQPPGFGKGREEGIVVRDGVVVCGDHRQSTSIEGAIISGRRAAEAAVEIGSGGGGEYLGKFTE